MRNRAFDLYSDPAAVRQVRRSRQLVFSLGLALVVVVFGAIAVAPGVLANLITAGSAVHYEPPPAPPPPGLQECIQRYTQQSPDGYLRVGPLDRYHPGGIISVAEFCETRAP